MMQMGAARDSTGLPYIEYPAVDAEVMYMTLIGAGQSSWLDDALDFCIA